MWLESNNIKNTNQPQPQPTNHLFYGHYSGQPVLAGTSVKNWRILLVQSFTASMPLLAAYSTFGLGRRRWIFPQQCYLHCLHTISTPHMIFER